MQYAAATALRDVTKPLMENAELERIWRVGLEDINALSYLIASVFFHAVYQFLKAFDTIHFHYVYGMMDRDLWQGSCAWTASGITLSRQAWLITGNFGLKKYSELFCSLVSLLALKTFINARWACCSKRIKANGSMSILVASSGRTAVLPARDPQ